MDPAYASFTENELGSIEAGKRADYAILSQNIMTVPAMSILKTKYVLLHRAYTGEPDVCSQDSCYCDGRTGRLWQDRVRLFVCIS